MIIPNYTIKKKHCKENNSVGEIFVDLKIRYIFTRRVDMAKFYKIVAVLCLIFFIIPVNKLTAGIFYVDKDAVGTNAGTSWQNAWGSFTDINWNVISPGDIIYISGGVISKTYYEFIHIPDGISGTDGNPITITKGFDSGHSGIVILDGVNIPNAAAVEINNSSFITVSNLDLRHWLDYPADRGTIGVFESDHIIIENNIILGWSQGIKIGGSHDCIIRNNSYTTIDLSSNQTDGIYASGNYNNIYEKNYINISNAGLAHNDCFQGQEEGPCIIRYNYMIHTGGSALKPVDSQGIFDKEGQGLHQYIGNFIYLPNSSVTGQQMNDFVLGQKRPTSGSASAYVLNNTIVGASTHTLSISTDNPIVKNNLIIMLDNIAQTRYDGNSVDPGLIDNNLYYKNGEIGNEVVLGYSNFVDWQSAGGDLHGLNVNPQVNSEFKTTPGSPPIDAGTNLINMGVLIDLLGVNRPQGSSFDVGAYEIIAGPDIYPPEVIGAVLLDPITLKISFSEPLEASTAQNSNNYSITGGISVFSASLMGSDVILNTSPHVVGSYTVTVNNVVDLAGNLISSENNSANYNMIILPGPGFPVDLYGTPESEKTAYFYLTIPGDTPEFITYHLIAFDADHGGGDPSEGQAFINDNGPIELFPGATQENGDGKINEFDIVVPKSWWINGVNELRFVRLYSTGYRINNAFVLFDVSSETQNENESLVGFTLEQNYPNPFNPSTKIKFTIPNYTDFGKTEFVTLKIYDALGMEVATLINKELQSGSYEVVFNLNTPGNSYLPSGIYFYTLRVKGFVQSKKMILLK
jgi:parallel beta-helix repeat protein